MTRRRAHLQLLPGVCEAPGCAWSHLLQKHRIIRGEQGGSYSLDNVIHLCPNHHWLADNSHYSVEELQRIVQERLR